MLVASAERPLRDEELPPVARDQARGAGSLSPRLPRPGVDAAEVVRVTTSPDGPPMFIVNVLLIPIATASSHRPSRQWLGPSQALTGAQTRARAPRSGLVQRNSPGFPS